MRKLALSDEILMKIEKPARYIGGEFNAIVKDHNEVDTTFAFVFPDVYEVGMSHLGIQILYDLLNRRDDVCCERVYSPWIDLDKIMREQNIPLFSLETQTPVKNFDFLAITLQYEMCYTNILQVLDLSGIPLLSKDRTEDDPIVIGLVLTILNQLQISLTFFISVKVKLNIITLLIYIRKIRKMVEQKRNFLKWLQKFLVCMFRLSTILNTMKMEQLRK